MDNLPGSHHILVEHIHFLHVLDIWNYTTVLNIVKLGDLTLWRPKYPKMIPEFMELCMCQGHSLGVAIGAPQVAQLIGEAGCMMLT